MYVCSFVCMCIYAIIYVYSKGSRQCAYVFLNGRSLNKKVCVCANVCVLVVVCICDEQALLAMIASVCYDREDVNTQILFCELRNVACNRKMHRKSDRHSKKRWQWDPNGMKYEQVAVKIHDAIIYVNGYVGLGFVNVFFSRLSKCMCASLCMCVRGIIVWRETGQCCFWRTKCRYVLSTDGNAYAACIRRFEEKIPPSMERMKSTGHVLLKHANANVKRKTNSIDIIFCCVTVVAE